MKEGILMTDAERREAARQFFQKWVGKPINKVSISKHNHIMSFLDEVKKNLPNNPPTGSHKAISKKSHKNW